MKVIGLTGGIGSGKSTVARLLAGLGAAVMDLDKVGHESLAKSGGAYQGVIKEFGQGILLAGGEIDRAKLGKIVFHDRLALQKLNMITHPAIDKAVDKKIHEYRRQGVKVVVLEAAALLESDKAWQVDEIWVTRAKLATVLERLKKRSGYSEAEARTRISAQMTDRERIKKAAVVIDTDCSLDELKTRVAAEWQKLQERLSD